MPGTGSFRYPRELPVKVQFLASSVGKHSTLQFLSSFIIDDFISIDAGAIGFVSSIDVQKQIRHVVLSHAHIDHIASLPLFLDTVYDTHSECPTVHASEDLQNCLQRDMFNNRLWPDLLHMPNGGSPFLNFSTLVDGQSVQLGNVRLTPVSVDHVIPCFGFLIEDDQTAIAFVSDTAPTQNIWDRIHDVRNLKAVFLEASFPNALQRLADKSMHLTPRDFGGEVGKIGHDVPVIAIHLKSKFHETIVEELKSLGLKRLEIGKPGHTYQF